MYIPVKWDEKLLDQQEQKITYQELIYNIFKFMYYY